MGVYLHVTSVWVFIYDSSYIIFALILLFKHKLLCRYIVTLAVYSLYALIIPNLIFSEEAMF